MTKNEERNHRYRPGKAVAEESDEDWSSDEDAAPASVAQPQPVVSRPVASTYRAPQKLPPTIIARQPDIDLEGFETASESSSEEGEDDDDDDEGESEEDSSSEEEESESEEEVKPRLIAPKFISKAQRARMQTEQVTKSEDTLAAEEEARRKEKTTVMLQAQIERDQAARAAGKKAWDDDDNDMEDDIDDTDDLDPEAEKAAWKLRELKRVKRDRLALIEKERELEEIERRRNLTAEEREAEDREFLEQQKAEQDGRGKMTFMQKYYHKGAFFQGDEEQDEEVKAALSRDLAGARFEDEGNKELLPEYMRIRDMTQLGRKSRSKYKDLKSEDTGRFGDFNDRQSRHHGLDDRFRPDEGGSTQTGANTAPLGTRRVREDDDAPRAEKKARYD